MLPIALVTGIIAAALLHRAGARGAVREGVAIGAMRVVGGGVLAAMAVLAAAEHAWPAAVVAAGVGALTAAGRRPAAARAVARLLRAGRDATAVHGASPGPTA